MNEAIALAGLARARRPKPAFARAAPWPRSSATRQNNGLWLLSAGRLTPAEQELQAARELAPHDETILYDLARIRLRQGRQAEAGALLTRARELNPANAAVDSLLRQAGG
jgi:Flp pilus assembly protein TadD